MHLLELIRINGELTCGGTNARMKALLDKNEREERAMMLDSILRDGWKPERDEIGKFRKTLPGGYILCDLDTAYSYELRNQ